MTNYDQKSDIRVLRGVGDRKAAAFAKLELYSLGDLLRHYPTRYEDRSIIKPLSSVVDGESCCVDVTVADEPRLSRIRKGLDLVRFHVFDESAMCSVTYFNQPYIANNLHRGDAVRFYGKFSVEGSLRSLTNPVIERENSASVTGRIMPVYRCAEGLNQRAVADAVKQALELCADGMRDALPESVRKRCELCGNEFAYRNIHFPSDLNALALARGRLIFEEFFIFFCALSRMREARSREGGIRLEGCDLSPFWDSLPYSPTGAQLRAVNSAVEDMRSGAVMNRLIQGDVGSGKTLIAAAIIWYTFINGLMSAFMAPTEILAKQHYKTLTELLAPFGVRTVLLTGSASAKEKREAKALLASGETDLVIGTHALFSKDVEYARLGLVVTDEQHRFGVRQRASLIGKGINPHVLVMSATPIPRTLALMLYGDLDVSIIDELPPGRQKIDTFAVDESYRERLNGFILKLCGEGRQVFVVCPKVEEGEDDAMPELKSAEEHAEALAQKLRGLRVGCVHGRMKGAEKDAVMSAFANGEIDVLVSTTVVEVGVDVPNACLMVIENADRFGLSQLHQLRGRVGRGSHKSWCILVSDSKTDEARARLKIMCQTNDGFKIAEEDLRLRGPGDFFGSRQHGLPEMRMAGLGSDMDVLERAQTEAKRLLADDPALEKDENAALRYYVDRLFDGNADSFN